MRTSFMRGALQIIIVFVVPKSLADPPVIHNFDNLHRRNFADMRL